MPSDALVYHGVECEVCKRTFVDPAQLAGHVRFVDGSAIPEPCPGGNSRA